MYNTSSNLMKLSNSECQSAFGTSKVQSPYLNVLVVTNYTSNNAFIDGLLSYPESGISSLPWFNENTNMSVFGCTSTYNYTQGQGTNWSLPTCACSDNECVVEQAFIQDCLAQPTGDFNVQCTISISLNMLIAVIVCNAMKAICFICMLRATSFHPLATVGDAVASFLNRPDPTTVACGPLSAETVEDSRNVFLRIRSPWSQRMKNWKQAYVWRNKKKYKTWGNAVKTGFVVFCAFMLLLAWITITIVLSLSWNNKILSSWAHDVTYSSYSGGSFTGSLVDNVLLVNTPQLIVSLVYVFYNSILTRMLVAYELSQFAQHRKALRVSRPSGLQLSTYWLQLPYRYILPLMVCMALIHFFISRGLYLVNIKVYNISGQEVPYRDRFDHETSALALWFAFLLGTAMLLALVICSYRRLKEGMPVLGTNSVAISSACHLALGDDNAATKCLMYGAIDAPPGDAPNEDRSGMKHVCFSSFDVEPLERGKRYY